MKQADVRAWFAGRSWKPFKFQREVWKAIADGRSGLLHATTGAGKTDAVWLGALMAFSAFSQVPRMRAAIKNIANNKNQKTEPLTVLWITPMRALAADTLASVRMVVVDEWHELIGNKRGVQGQLANARPARRRAVADRPLRRLSSSANRCRALCAGRALNRSRGEDFLKLFLLQYRHRAGPGSINQHGPVILRADALVRTAVKLSL